MKRSTARASLFLVVAAMLAVALPAQITLLNSGSLVTNPFVSTVGTSILIDNTTFRVGTSSVSRAANIASSASYLPTGAALNPANGFTIQFWYRRTAVIGGNADYVFGDSTMVAPVAAGASGGAFRCFVGGVAGVGNLLLRGVSNQLLSVNAPVPVGSWVHLAFRYDPPTNTLALLVNGVVNTSIAQTTTPFNWTGTNLHHVGYSGSTSILPAMNIDDLRIYGFSRTNADILADYQVAAAGLGPSALPNLPDKAYFDFEGSVQPHNCTIGTNLDALATGNRIITGGTLMEWGGNSPNQPGLPASCIVNIHGPSLGHPVVNPYPIAYRPPPALPVAYATPASPGIVLGHGFSSPANGSALCWPDGIGLGVIPGLFFFAVPGAYNYQTSPNALFVMPPGIFQTGDTLDFQFIAPDAAYPLNIGTSNRATFVYSNCGLNNPGAHCHVEARGNGAIQVSGFWEVHNTGTVDITQVVIDATTCAANGGTAQGFYPPGALNTGGTLTAGSSYRLSSEAYTGLQNLPSGFTGLTPYTTTTALAGVRGLQFAFNSFTACTDEFLFDCESDPASTSGNAYIGATVTVTFANSTILTGLMVADPTATNAAIINL